MISFLYLLQEYLFKSAKKQVKKPFANLKNNIGYNLVLNNNLLFHYNI